MQLALLKMFPSQAVVAVLTQAKLARIPQLKTLAISLTLV
jgi:hypothetical protein